MTVIRQITVKDPTEAEDFTRLHPFASATQEDLEKAIRLLFDVCQATGITLHIEPPKF